MDIQRGNITGERIRRLREEAGLSQRGVAELLTNPPAMVGGFFVTNFPKTIFWVLTQYQQ